MCILAVCRVVLTCVCPQRWAHLTTPVWGPHHMEYMAPDAHSRTPALPPCTTDHNKVIIFESVM